MILTSVPLASALLSAAAAVAYAVPAAGAARLSMPASRTALLAAWLLHGVVLCWSLFGGTPRFGFAPAISITAWLVLTVYAVESYLFPQLQARWALAGLGTATVLLAFLFPGNPIQTSFSPWLDVHFALGIATYGLVAAAVIHAWLMQRAEKQMRQAADSFTGVPLLTLERITFRLVTAGFILLSATLLAGWFFGEQLNRPWKWDHKTVFSVLAWLTFAVLLIGRSRFGWRGRKAVRVLYAGAGWLLLAYVGSRFVLEVLIGRAPA